MADYSDKFYDHIRDGAQTSASVVADILYRELSPGSVVDIGCGEGHWAKAFEDLGATVTGVDGSYVNNPVVLFVSADLSESIPFNQLEESYDLAISLEVAEHLPERRASSFVDDLCSLSNNILFSAAVPGQPGTGHVNCQWFDKFWEPLFNKNGYSASGMLRFLLWQDDRVEWWYQQNLMFITKTPESFPTFFLPKELAKTYSVVHPVLWESVNV